MNLWDRLYNWKFASASTYLEGQPEETVAVVKALGRMLGDVGWGLDGDLRTIVDAALKSLPAPAEAVRAGIGHIEEPKQETAPH